MKQSKKNVKSHVFWIFKKRKKRKRDNTYCRLRGLKFYNNNNNNLICIAPVCAKKTSVAHDFRPKDHPQSDSVSLSFMLLRSYIGLSLNVGIMWMCSNESHDSETLNFGITFF